MAQQIVDNGTSAGDKNGEVLFSAWKKTNENFAELYSYHEEESGFESRSDTTTQESQTAATDNPFLLTGTGESNGDISLLDSLGNITPRAIGDVIIVDIAFTSIVPIGSNLYSVVKLLVNGVVYRATTQNIIKGVGLDDYFSVSWTLPVGADFKTYGGTIYVNPISTLLIKNRYIQVTQVHKSR